MMMAGSSPSSTVSRDRFRRRHRLGSTSIADSTTGRNGIGSLSSRSCPAMMRDTSRMSSTIFCCSRALRSIVSSAFARRASSICVLRSSDVHPSTALSGVRSSCDTVARNSSFSRFAISAVSRAFCTASNSRALSMAIAACAASPATMRSSLFGEHVRLGVAEEQPAEHLSRSGRSQESRDSCAPAGGRAECRDAARSGRSADPCVTSARRTMPLAAERRAEQRRRARQRKSLEVPAIDARHRVEHVRAAALVEDVVEERAELRANQIGRRVGERLHQLLAGRARPRAARPKLLMICSASACSRCSFFRAHRLGDVLHDAQHPEDGAVFAVCRVSARGDPFFACARPECGTRCRSRTARDGRLDGDSRALAIVGMQKLAQLGPGHHRPRRHVEDLRGARRKGDDVGGGVPAPVAEPGGVERKAQAFGVGVTMWNDVIADRRDLPPAAIRRQSRARSSAWCSISRPMGLVRIDAPYCAF